jgi:hypothetical protein
MKISSITYLVILTIALIILISIIVCVGLFIYYYFTDKIFEYELILVLLTLLTSILAFSLLTFNQLKNLYKLYKI